MVPWLLLLTKNNLYSCCGLWKRWTRWCSNGFPRLSKAVADPVVVGSQFCIIGVLNSITVVLSLCRTNHVADSQSHRNMKGVISSLWHSCSLVSRGLNKSQIAVQVLFLDPHFPKRVWNWSLGWRHVFASGAAGGVSCDCSCLNPLIESMSYS